MKKGVLEELEKIVGKERMSDKTADLYVYGFDASIHHKTPDAIVKPLNVKEVSEIVKLANRTRTPDRPQGCRARRCAATRSLSRAGSSST